MLKVLGYALRGVSVDENLNKPQTQLQPAAGD
jgi:hypothetical protein